MMLHTKYPGFRPCGFILEDFSYFAYIGLCKICDPRGRAISRPKGYNLRKLGRGPPGDAKYQLSIV